MKLSQLIAAMLASSAAPGFIFSSPPPVAPLAGRGRRGGNRHAPRSRVPGPRQPAGSKLFRMASEARLVR